MCIRDSHLARPSQILFPLYDSLYKQSQMNLLFAARGKFDENNFDNFSWEKYKDWSKIYQLDELVSLDGMLNEDLIEPDYDNEEDWNNIDVYKRQSIYQHFGKRTKMVSI